MSSLFFRLYLTIASVTLVILSGCTTVNKTSFKEMSNSYRETVEQYNNDNILINIVRSSKNLPVSFLDIPSVLGTGNFSANASMSASIYSNNPSSLLGFFSALSSSPSSYVPALGMSVNNGFTFTQSSLDNSVFTNVFLSSMKLDSLEFKGSEPYLPKVLLYNLYFGRINATSENGEQELSFLNNPLDPDYPKFVLLLNMLMDAGLRTEENIVKIPIGPPIPENEVVRLPAWNEGKLTFEHSVIGGKGYYTAVKQTIETRLCLNKYAAISLFGDRISSVMYCKLSPKYELAKDKYKIQLEYFDEKYGSPKIFYLSFTTRSLATIFNYLGSIMIADNSKMAKGEASIAMLPKSYLSTIEFGNKADKIPLFIIRKNQSVSNPIASVEYRGDTYAIEDEDNSYTKVVLQLLSTLLKLTKSPGSIPNANPNQSVTIK